MAARKGTNNKEEMSSKKIAAMFDWNDINKDDLQYEIVKCMESLRPAIYQIVSNADENIAFFDYYVDAYVDHEIIFMDDGWEFASATTDQFESSGQFMRWALEAITTYYEDQEKIR